MCLCTVIFKKIFYEIVIDNRKQKVTRMKIIHSLVCLLNIFVLFVILFEHDQSLMFY